MTAYADTGFLCSLYAPDLHTARAAARMKRQALPLPLTWLHHVEFPNASLNALLADVAGGVLAGAARPWPRS